LQKLGYFTIYNIVFKPLLAETELVLTALTEVNLNKFFWGVLNEEKTRRKVFRGLLPSNSFSKTTQTKFFYQTGKQLFTNFSLSSCVFQQKLLIPTLEVCQRAMAHLARVQVNFGKSL
jgi:hypothetical protein